MTSLTVRNLPDDAKRRFRQVAAAHGRSMEEHLRQLVIGADFGATSDSFAPHAGVSDVRPAFRHAASATDPRAASRARIERLIELGRGLDWEPEPRAVGTIKGIPFA